MLVFGNSDEFEWYNFYEQKWYSGVLKNKPDVIYRRMAILGNDLYLIGGLQHDNKTNKVDIYNFQTKSWRAGVPMNVKRSGHCVVVMNSKIYAVSIKCQFSEN